MLRKGWLSTGPQQAFVFTSLVNSVGTGFFLAGATVYYNTTLHLSPVEIGLGLGVSNAAGFFASVPVGRLADRIGARVTLVTLHLWRALWFGALALISGDVPFITVLTCIAIANSAVIPVTRAVVSEAVPAEQRTKTLAHMRVVQNVGFSAGSLLSAPLLALHNSAGSRAIVIADAASFLVAAWVMARVKLPSRPVIIHRPSIFQVPRALRDHRLIAVAGLDGLLAFHVTILGTAIPLWVLHETSAPDQLVSVLFFINTLMAAGLQAPFASNADSYQGGRRLMRLASVALTCCCLLMCASVHLEEAAAICMLIAAVVALTTAELSEQAGSWALSLRYSPANERAEYLTVFNLGYAAQEVIGPPVITELVLAHGRLGWITLSVILACAGAAVGPALAALERRLPRPEESTPLSHDVGEN
jgi:MFS family permease